MPPLKLDASRLPAAEMGRGVPGPLRLPVGRPAGKGMPALAAAFRFREIVAFWAMPRPSWSRAGTLAILKAGPARYRLILEAAKRHIMTKTRRQVNRLNHPPHSFLAKDCGRWTMCTSSEACVFRNKTRDLNGDVLTSNLLEHCYAPMHQEYFM